MKTPNKKNGEAEIYGIKKTRDKLIFTRKEFLGAIGTIGAVLSLKPVEALADKIEVKGLDLSVFKAHNNEVTALKVRADGEIIASGSSDGTAKLWSLPDGKLLKTFPCGSVDDLSFSPDGKILAIGYRNINQTEFWYLPTGKSLGRVMGHKVRISPDSKMVATLPLNNTIRLTSLTGLKPLKTLSLKDKIEVVCFSPDSKLLAWSGMDHQITLWSLHEDKVLKMLAGHREKATDLCFRSDGKILASAGEDKTIMLWSVPEGTLIKTLEGHTQTVNSVCFNPGGNWLASGSSDNTVKIWSVPEGSDLLTLKIETNEDVNVVCFTPDGQTLVAGGADKTIRLWTMPEGDPCFVIFDPSVTEKTDAMQVKQMGPGVLTLPCGSPIPPGATCICDCIADSRSYPGTEMVCTCNTITLPAGAALSGTMICICNTITIGSSSTYSGYHGGTTYYNPGTYYGGTTYYRTYWYPN